MNKPYNPMSGKVCMVTGANSGIGRATALGLAKLGATVVMVCRDRSKGEAAQAEIIAQGGTEAVDLMVADLSSQQSIRQAVQEFKSRYNRLNVLINNAAVNLFERSVTEDGIEMTFAVNHLAPFLLTSLLLDVLKASRPARIINVTSSAQASIDFDDLMSEKQYNVMQVYARTKMANVLFTYELARRLTGTGVTVNCADPGIVRTNLGRHFTGFFRLMLTVMWPFMASPAKGAETSIYLAASAEVEGVSGKYFKDKKEARSAEISYDEAVAQRLWQVSAKLVKFDS